jgi:hypothetical protein
MKTLRRFLVFTLTFLSGANFASPQEPPLQSWDQIAEHPASGLSPLYAEAADVISKILEGQEQQRLLPRSVSVVSITRDGAPCFGINTCDWNANGFGANAQVRNWVAEQTWDGRFRLICSAFLVDKRENDAILLRTLGPFKGLFYRDGASEWVSLAVKRHEANPNSPGPLAEYPTLLPQGGYAVVLDGQLARYLDGQWTVAPNHLSDDERLLGLQVNQEGQFLTWFSLVDGERIGTAFQFGGPRGWEKHVILNPSSFSDIVFCDNGLIVLHEDNEWTILNPLDSWNSDTVHEEDLTLPNANTMHVIDSVVDPFHGEIILAGKIENDTDQSETQQVAIARLTLTPSSRPYYEITSAAYAAFPSTVDLSDVPPPSRPNSHYVIHPYSSAYNSIAAGMDQRTLPRKPRLEVLSRPEGGAVIFSESFGIGWTDRESEQIRFLEGVDVLQDDYLLGCDQGDIVYVKRSGHLIAYSLHASRSPSTIPRVLASVPDAYPHARINWNPTLATLNSEGTLIFATPDLERNVLVQYPGEVEPVMLDDRLSGAKSLWPGRNGSFLIELNDSRTVLASVDGELLIAASLQDLCESHFDAVFAAAPRNPFDQRRLGSYINHISVNRSRALPHAAPWMSTSDALWTSDPETQVVRRYTEDDREGTVIANEGHFLFGRLTDGSIILAQRGMYRRPDEHLWNWNWIEDPDGQATLRDNTFFSNDQVRGFPPRVTQSDFEWFHIDEGSLLIEGGSDALLEMSSIESWDETRFFGLPGFEHPQGTVWGFHTFGVLAGWEIRSGDQCRSAFATYKEPLTPVLGLDDQVICVTPTGLASFSMDGGPNSPVRHQHVQWPATPMSYASFIGRMDNQLIFLLDAYDDPILVSVECDFLSTYE